MPVKEAATSNADHGHRMSPLLSGVPDIKMCHYHAVLPRSIAQSYEPNLHRQHTGLALTCGVAKHIDWLKGFVSSCRICTGLACNIWYGMDADFLCATLMPCNVCTGLACNI